MRKSLLLLLLTGSAYLLSSVVAPPPEQMQVGTLYENRVLVPTNQLVNPAGRRISFPGRPLDIAINPRGDLVAVFLSGSVRLYSPSGEFVRSIGVGPSAGGIAFQPDGSRLWISEMPAAGHRITAFNISGSLVKSIPLPANSGPAGMAIDPAGKFAYVALNLTNLLARVDLASGAVSTTPVGIAPLCVALALDGSRIFVTNQGGFRPEPGQPTASSAGTSILVDERGIARSGSLSVVDTGRFKSIAEVRTGLLPGAVRISPDGLLAAVANANSDSVTLIRTDTLQPYPAAVIRAFPSGFGSSPTALAFSATGDRLYVACPGNNSVAVLVRTQQANFSGKRNRRAPYYSFAGAFPTDWYPMSIAAGPDDTLYVANLKGIGTRDATSRFSIGSWLGTINILSAPSIDQALTQAASDANQPFRNAIAPADSPADLHTLGIEHVFLIIKENRTYDQVLGDVGLGNSDPTLALYGRQITPNQHALAAQFTLLDNYFAAGTVSPDGHQWLAQSIVTSYLERAHGTYSRSYPYSGEDALAFAPSGFLWNNAQAHGLTARVYGEYTLAANSYSSNWADYIQDANGPMQLITRGNSAIAALNPLVEHEYPAFALNVPDVYRARKFLDRFQQFEATHSLPNLVIIQLPTDHTVGITPNAPSPNAMLADNDLAAGRIVDAISNSSYWPKSAIFMTEDDAQDGVDHVDGHRTLCFVISPYTRRRAVDSTHYNHTSVIRTIEDLLGLPTMNKFDAAALPMRSVFVTTPDLTGFHAVPNIVPLTQVTAALNALPGDARRAAAASSAMNFSIPDAAPEDDLNRILWHAARGWHTPYPRVPHGPDCPPDKD
jgi:DNA-binding beta-propeller fold protein YncE